MDCSSLGVGRIRYGGGACRMTRPDMMLLGWFVVLVVLAWHGRKP
jgi:hypothetical protein